MKFLITGFEPFGGSAINPSERVIKALENEPIPAADIKLLVLPVDRYRATEQLLKYIDEEKPNVLISLGEAGGRSTISIERVAINLMDYRIADNDGNIAEDLPVVPGGPDAYFSTLPVRGIFSALTNAGIPANLSLTAGAFLCNQVMYSALHHIATHKLNISAGFIHLPILPEQACLAKSNQPSMSLELMATAMRLITDPKLFETAA